MTNTTDYSLADQTGSQFRTEINNILSDIQTTNIGTSAPTTAVKGKIWIDDTNDKIKVYDGSSWVDLGASFTQDMGHATKDAPSLTGTVTSAGDIVCNSTSRLKIPVGTTAQRPSSAATGDSRYNSTIGQQEIYDGTRWVSAFVPVGTVSYYAGSTPPKGYLKCNGATIADGNTAITGNDADGDAIGTINTSKLYAIIGATLPDLRGEFIRGWSDDRSGVDASRSIRSTQAAENEEHDHYLFTNTSQSGSGTGSSNTITEWAAQTPSVNATDFHAQESGTPYSNANFEYAITVLPDEPNVVKSGKSGDETRPRNVALLAIIKY
jgi:microcystin-dependent protein